MKRNIIFLMLALVFFISSCKKDKVEYNEFGAEFIVTPSITSLDNVLRLDAKVFGVTDPIAVTHLGGTNADGDELAPTSFTADLGSITLANGEGTLLIPDSKLGINEVGATFNLKLTGKKDGVEFYRYITVEVESPFKITLPQTKDKKLLVVQEDAKIYKIGFNITPATSALAGFVIERKVSKAGTYTTLLGTYTAKDTIRFAGTDFKGKDTVYYRFTATAGNIDSEVATIPVAIYSYSNKVTLKLAPSLTESLDLLQRKLVNSTVTDSADIEYTYADVTGGFNMGFIAKNEAVFIKYAAALPNSAADIVYSEADRVAIDAADFSSMVKLDANLAVGDVFVFRTKRGTGSYKYGVFKITGLVKPNGAQLGSYIELQLKY